VRSKLLVANWKTYIKDLVQVNSKIDDINRLLKNADRLVICAPFVYIDALISGIKNPDIAVGSQNLSSSESNASTGEILASMQKDMGCKYAIIGHSEIRERYVESNETVAIKARIALKHGIKPIICIGESYAVRSNGDYIKFLINQLIESIPPIKNPSEEIIIAYEPVWAIGTGATPSIYQIDEVIGVLKLILELENCIFIYGGSVNENNIEEISTSKTIGGVLVGGASADINKLSAIHAHLQLNS
jgi:triosephosphate isomerase